MATTDTTGVFTLPERSGRRPRTTRSMPHVQEDQNGLPELQQMLAARVFALPDVEERATLISAPGARAIWLRDTVDAGPADAFLIRREIGHFHPWDGSMHLALPPDLVSQAVAAGWAEVHPMARTGGAPGNLVMIFGPRDACEVDAVFSLILASYRRAGGRERAIQRRIARTVTTPPPAPGFIGEGHLAVEVVSPKDFAEHDPFIALMDDRIELAEGLPAGGAHPHAGFETVTFMLEGSVHDADEGVLNTGDVQWMTAGQGIIHGEHVVPQGKTRLLQLWLTLPKADRWTTPAFQNIRRDSVPVRRERGVEIHLYSGSSGDQRSSTPNHVPVTLADITLAAGATVEQDLPIFYNGFLYILDGSVRVGDDNALLQTGQVGWLDRPTGVGTSILRVTAGNDGARLVLYAGQPQHESIVIHGPFVGDSRADIVRLFNEYRAGNFERLSELTRAGAMAR
jgi:quercetin 2,3-dioxygenase